MKWIQTHYYNIIRANTRTTEQSSQQNTLQKMKHNTVVSTFNFNSKMELKLIVNMTERCS